MPVFMSTASPSPPNPTRLRHSKCNSMEIDAHAVSNTFLFGTSTRRICMPCDFTIKLFQLCEMRSKWNDLIWAKHMRHRTQQRTSNCAFCPGAFQPMCTHKHARIISCRWWTDGQTIGSRYSMLHQISFPAVVVVMPHERLEQLQNDDASIKAPVQELSGNVRSHKCISQLNPSQIVEPK